MRTSEQLVLYVDDEWANRVVFEQTFSGRFRVSVVGSGKEALEVFEREAVAVVLTDQRMPGMTGEELLTQVKSLYPDTIRVVITAYSDLDPILRAVNEGLVARYLIKPWDRRELERIIYWALEAYELHREGSALQLRLIQTERLVTLGSIGAAMLHDLAQPLGHLALSSERLVHLSKKPSQGDGTAEVSEIAQEMLASCRMMKGLLTQLRRFFQPVPQSEPRAANPVSVIRYALSVCREVAVRAQGRLVYEGPAELPPVATSPTELAQIFINLVSNGAQALLQKGQRGGAVTIGAALADRAIEFQVRDDGVGMAPDILAKAGTPFFSTRPDGTGLGVSQCRRLIESAGGKLGIQSQTGQGTTITFLLPTV